MTDDDLLVHPIDPTRLAAMRAAQEDERGVPFHLLTAESWEPLRCCLSFPAAGDRIALIGYSPFGTLSPWAETGPVYLHPTACPGYATPGRLPDRMRTGPRILRTYRADGSLAYDHITQVPPGADLAEPLRALLADPGVTTVHVRAVLSQCFAYAVTRPTVG